MEEEKIKFEPILIAEDFSLIETNIGLLKWISLEEFESLLQSAMRKLRSEAKLTQKL